jgi:nucleotide-binding universal stress UspA family protein
MFNRILIPLDGSSLAEQALGPGAAIARASGAAVDVVSVYEPIVRDMQQEPLDRSVREETRRYIEGIADELSSGAGVSATHATFEGDAIGRIANRAREIDADLIVMTSHGRTGLSRMWLGSVADGLIRHSNVPVLLLRPIDAAAPRPFGHGLYKHILVPLDGSAASEDVLPAALALAKCGGARVSLLRVVPLIPLISAYAVAPFGYASPAFNDPAIAEMKTAANQQLDGVAVRLRDEGADVDVHVVVELSVAQTILDFARTHGMNLIALSTRGRGLSRLLVGSVADKVLRAGDSPLLVYRPLGAEQGTSTEASDEASERSPQEDTCRPAP